MRDGNGEVAGPGMWEGEGQFVGCSSTVACSCLSHVTVCHIYPDAGPVTLLVRDGCIKNSSGGPSVCISMA
jgi:hypothetical protein